MIDWLFEVVTIMKIHDRTVIFQCINLMDQYYEQCDDKKSEKDLQLTAVTALFMATKNLEVEPLDMRTCVKTICYNKYSKQDFLEKEKEIRKAVNYENEASTCLDFILLYMKLVKVRL